MAENREAEQVDSRDCDYHPSVMAFYHLRDHQLNARANEVTLKERTKTLVRLLELGRCVSPQYQIKDILL